MYSSGIDSPYLMSALIDIYEEELKSGVADSNCLDQVLEVGWYYYIVYPHYLTLNDKDWIKKCELPWREGCRGGGVVEYGEILVRRSENYVQ